MALAILTAPQLLQPSRNPWRIRMQASGFSALENYRVVISMAVEGTPLPDIYAYPDSQGIISLELSEVLHAQIATLISQALPNFSQPYALDTIYTISFGYQEWYGAPPSAQGDSSFGFFTMMYGGIDYRIAEELPNSYFPSLSPLAPWASWWPAKRLVSRAMPNWIAVHNVAGSPALEMDLECFDEAGQTVFFPAPQVFSSLSLTAPAIHKIGVFPIGPNQLGLPLSVVSYRVRLKGSNVSQWSNWLHYIVDRVPKRIERYLVCYNVWNVPEVIRCTGRRSKQATYSPINVVRPFPAIRSTLGTRFQAEGNQDATYVYRTGYLTAREIDVVTGLMGIGRFWEVEGESYLQLTPVNLSTLPAQTDSDELYALELEFQRAMPPINYSPQLDDVAQDTSPYWLLPDGVTAWETPDDKWEIA